MIIAFFFLLNLSVFIVSENWMTFKGQYLFLQQRGESLFGEFQKVVSYLKVFSFFCFYS